MSCPSDAISMVRREGIENPLPDLKSLSQGRLAEKASQY
jgi:hypothetical protein